MLSVHVKFVQTDRRTDNGKNNIPPIFRCGGIKITRDQNQPMENELLELPLDLVKSQLCWCKTS